MNDKYTKSPWGWQDFGNAPVLVAQHGHREIIISANHAGMVNMSDDGILLVVNENHPNAKLIAAAPELLEALIEISEGSGAYSLDPLTHASNCIDNMKRLALEAIIKATL